MKLRELSSKIRSQRKRGLGEKEMCSLSLRNKFAGGKIMRQYREQIYMCGNILDAPIYPVINKQCSRRKKFKPTSEIQSKLNQTNAEYTFVRYLHANFGEKDLALELDYKPELRPTTDDEADKHVRNFIRRIKRYCKNHNLPDIKYIITTEFSGNGNVHHHLVISGGIDRDVLEQLWGMGRANSKRLQFNQDGIEDLGKYITKRSRYEGKCVYKKRWTGSRNLIKPQAKERTGKITKTQLKMLNDENISFLELASFFQNLYPGYIFNSVDRHFNPINLEYYFHVKMYRKDYINPIFKKKKE